MSRTLVEDLATGYRFNRLNVPTATICRRSSAYLRSITDVLPDDVKNLIEKYPYMTALVFSLGADCVTWVKSADRGGDFLLSEIRNTDHRDKGFPIFDILESRIYARELSLIAELGFYYEVDYLQRNGFDVSEYGRRCPEDCIRHNDVLFSVPDRSLHGRIETERIVTMFFHTKDDVEMLRDGNGHVPELLTEKMSILREMLDEYDVCYDGGLVTGCDFLPGKIQIVSEVIGTLDH